MMPSTRSGLRVVWLALSLSHFAGAFADEDVVFLQNGDRITGEVIGKEGDFLKINTSYAGTVSIEWKEVAHFETDDPETPLMKDEFVPSVSEFSKSPEPESFAVSGKEPATLTGLDEVTGINPDDPDMGSKGRFKGNINLSLKMQNGSVDKDELDGDFEVSYERGDHRFWMSGQVEYDEALGRTIKRDWSVIPKYDYFFGEKAYASMTYLATQEEFRGLDLRQMVGPSLGYQFSEGKPRALRSEIGFIFVDETFVALPDSDYYGPSWFLEYEQELFEGGLQLYHRHFAFLGAESGDNKQLWRSWTGFSLPLAGGFRTSIELELDYDSQSSLRAEELDSTFRLKTGFEW